MKHILALCLLSAASALGQTVTPTPAPIPAPIPAYAAVIGLPPLKLTSEQLAAIDGAVATANASLPAGTAPQTRSTYLMGVLNAQITTLVTAAYNATVAQLGTAAKGLTFAQRLALINQVQATLSATPTPPPPGH